ncbi:hypothetical protein H0266_15125 [Halobacillus locisalis]|uniref:Uncharacterized protein n=1 Tax=Halobacillus locisalis TaxID=220753 RepID=A0A838CWB8_9BACI|nr:hypothetical protein [Halobacillus locisalis]MBA2176228.1 hypothetical protein [Halobacillus locisalis]
MNPYRKMEISKIFELYSFLIEKIHTEELSTIMFQETNLLEKAALDKGFKIFNSKKNRSLSLVFYYKHHSISRQYWYLSHYS